MKVFPEHRRPDRIDVFVLSNGILWGGILASPTTVSWLPLAVTLAIWSSLLFYAIIKDPQ